MELVQLRYFLTAAQNGHITRAAEELHVAQPALTQSIRRLEKELGVPLFTRKGRGVALNEYGTYLMRRLTPLLASLDSLPAELEELAQQENHTVRINILAASSLMTRAIIAYQRAVGAVKFKLVQNMEDESCDISVTGGAVPEQWAYNRTEYHAFKENILLAVLQDSVYAAQKTIRLSEMAQAEFISLTGQKQFRSVCDMFCAAAGFIPKIVFESDSIMAVQDLIGAGQGVGFWPEYSWGKVNEEIVTLRPISDPVCQRNLVLHLHSARRNASVSRDFYDFLVQYIFESSRA